MGDVSQKLAKDRLAWIEDARQGILLAIGDDVVHPQFKAFPSTDPLKFYLTINLHFPLGKNTREPIRTYLRCWAESQGCEIPIIRITKYRVQAEILTQTRVWNRDYAGKFHKGAKRFETKKR